MKPKVKPLDLLIPIIVASIGCFASFYLSNSFVQNRLEERQNDFLNEIKSESEELRALIEGKIIAKMYLAKSLTSYVKYNPEIDQKAFSDFAANVYEMAEGEVLSVQLVKDSIIKYNYPIEGNEVTFGKNITQFDQDIKYVREAIMSKSPMLIGPRVLLQGELGLVYRDPIILKNGDLWGYSAMVIDIEKLVTNLDINNALWQFSLFSDGEGLDGSGFFFGNDSAKAKANFEQEISVLDDKWTLFVAPKLQAFYDRQIVRNTKSLGLFSFVLSLIFGFFLGLMCYFLIRQAAHNKQLKIQNQSIEEDLEEKNTLIREVHHRIKNHFQLMNSINNILYTDSEDEKVQEVIKEINNRISSISELYTQLGSHDVQPLNTKKYIESLSTNLIRGSSENVKLNIEVGVDKLPVKKTAYMGVILNEMITNSLKYAFDATTEAGISINLKEDDDNIELEYLDSGGKLKETDLSNLNSKGIELMSLFVQQLEGQLQFLKKANWVGYFIRFSKH